MMKVQENLRLNMLCLKKFDYSKMNFRLKPVISEEKFNQKNKNHS